MTGPAAAPPPRRTRPWPMWVPTALTGVFVVATTVSGAVVGGTRGPTQVTWIAVQAVSALLAFAVPTLTTIRQRRRHRESERARIAARTEIRVALGDALDPIVRLLGRIATSESRRDRATLRGQAVPFVLSAANEVIGPDRTRASWYELDADDDRRRLRPVDAVGRAGLPHDELVEGTPAGDDALTMIETDAVRYRPRLRAGRAPDWDPNDDVPHGAFVAVPVVAGDVAYGVLTLDAPEPGDLSEDDAQLLRLLGGLLADALALDS